MLEVYACIAQHHDIRFVALATAICLLSSLTAVALAKHVRKLGLAGRFRWIFLTGYVSGVGIYATHFVAMLAYQPNLPTAYLPVGTALSLVVSIVMSVIGWRLHFSNHRHGTSLAALAMTAGIAAMHFIGMSAMKTQGTFIFDQTFVGLSIFAAGLFVSIALQGRGRLPGWIQALALTAAICSLHFGSMAAVAILPDGAITIPDLTVSRQMMTLGVATAVLAILIVAVFALTLSVQVKRASDEVSRIMSRDPLTGVLNASAFDSAVNRFLSDRKSDEGQVAIARIALDWLPKVEEEQGHQNRDYMLVEIAKRLDAFGVDGFVGRSGGDEFIVLLRSDDPLDDIDMLIGRLRECVTAVVHLGDKPIRPEVSMGVARCPDHGNEMDQLRRTSGFALYNAKMTGRGTLLEYDSSMEQHTKERHEFEAALRTALRQDQFSLEYQPISCVTTGGVVGFEALLRWKHPTLGSISPARFVPVAERTGLMVEIGNWVLVEACRQAARWKQPLKVTVNLSAVQFLDAELVDKIRWALADSGLDPPRLALEITEGVLIDDADKAIEVLREIKGLGVRIAMDDFGTGFSSLSYFRQFPFDKVKIDQSFVRDMIANRQSLAIIRAVIGLGRALDMVILAEGVETAEQLDVLAMEGCQQAQGYLIGKPASAESYTWLTEPVDAPSHYCGGNCDACLERLRPPCQLNSGGTSSLLITIDAARGLAA